MLFPENHEWIERDISQDPEAERIVQFQKSLVSVNNIEIINPEFDFEEKDPVNYSIKRFLAYEYDKTPTLFINPELGIDTSSKISNIEFTPLIARGGKRSAHGVFFGKLSVDGEQLNIAVKPHTVNALKTGPDDYFKNLVVKKFGHYNLSPAGLYIVNEEEAYSMTILDEGLSTLDSIDWTEYYPNIDNNPGMQEMWRSVSGQAALLHASGNKMHGDMAARNIATSADGFTFFIDWEYARLSEQKPRDAETRYNHSYGDLSVLLESMCLPPHADIGGKAGIGILYGKNCDWWEAFCEIFYNEYLFVRTSLAEEGSHHIQTMYEVEDELTELTRSLRDEIQMMQDICKSIPPKTR